MNWGHKQLANNNDTRLEKDTTKEKDRDRDRDEPGLSRFQSSFKRLMLTDSAELKSNNDAYVPLAHDLIEDQIPLTERLEIYRNNIISSLTTVMVDTFPIVEKLVGVDFFRGMARKFICINPPEQSCLHEYGTGFATFIQDFEPVKHLNYLPDIAQLEISTNVVYHAKDTSALTAIHLSQIAEDELANLKISLRDSVALLESKYRLLDIRDFALNAGTPPDSIEGKQHLLVYRAGLDTEIMLIEESEYNFLNQLKEHNLGDALATCIQDDPNFNLQHILNKHLNLGTFAGLNTPNNA